MLGGRTAQDIYWLTVLFNGRVESLTMCKASWKCTIACQNTILIQSLQLCCNMSSLSTAFSSWRKELYLDMSFNATPVVWDIVHDSICKISLSSSFHLPHMWCMYLYMPIYIYAHMNMCINLCYTVVASAVQCWYREPWKSHLCPRAFLFSSSYVNWTRESHCYSLLTLGFSLLFLVLMAERKSIVVKASPLS